MLTDWFTKPPQFFKWVNAVVILCYKPIRSSSDLMIKDIQKLQRFYKAVYSCNAVKIGFDSCSVSGIVSWMDVNSALIESCESARFSAFISEDLRMYPCSFMVNTNLFGDLQSQSLTDIWHKHPAFVAHRETIIVRHARYKNYAMEVVSLSQKLINVVDEETPPVKTYIKL